MSMFVAKVDLKKAFQDSSRIRGIEARTMTLAVDCFRSKVVSGEGMSTSKWVDPEYTTLSGGGLSVDIKVPYEALEILHVQAVQAGHAVDLREQNWEKLSRQYHEKTGPFAPRL